LFGYTKQAYYKTCNTSKRKIINEERAKEAVLYVRRKMPRIGTRKLHFMLKEKFESEQIKVGRATLFRILKREGLLILKRRKYKVTTNSRHWMHKYPNLLKSLSIKRPEQVWAADITWIDTQKGEAYLHLITDVYSKQIVGYELCNDLNASSTLKALQRAIKNRRYPLKSLIHHSDRGVQYCSTLYTDFLKENNIGISMTENSDPYENAVAERMNGILKEEFGLGEKMSDLKQATILTKESIQTYNHLRPHLSCKMLTPNQMHRQELIPLKTWKSRFTKTPTKQELS